jgi:proline iminopeptidase
MRFFDARFDATPLFAEAEFKPGLLKHILGTLAPAWDVSVGSSGLRTPIFIAHGRYDYTVPYFLWESVAARLASATLRVFEHSGHQPFFEEPDQFAEALTDWMSGER